MNESLNESYLRFDGCSIPLQPAQPIVYNTPTLEEIEKLIRKIIKEELELWKKSTR